jgi:S1-C subfamily serine protease
MKYVKMVALITFGLGILALSVFTPTILAQTETSSTGPIVAVSDAAMQKWVRSVTVQVQVNLDKWTRSITWYQEVDAQGNRGEWKPRYGDWSKEPERIVVQGTGVIIYSQFDPNFADAAGTYILTNAHVVDYLVKSEKLGSRWNPIDVYDEKDLVISTYPPSVTVKAGARPIAQMYFTTPSNYVCIKYDEEQFFTIYAKIVDFDEALDIALLQICDPQGKSARVWGLPYATFRDSPCMVGEEVWICSAPLGIPFSIDKGRINQVRLDLGPSGGIVWNKQVKLDIAAAPGSSGSGIFDKNGYLIACLHGVLVYQGNYIRGGQLAIEGTLIRQWLIWRGWAFLVTAKPHPNAPYYKP